MGSRWFRKIQFGHQKKLMDRKYPTGKIEKPCFRNAWGYFTSTPLHLGSPSPHFRSGGRDFKLTSVRFVTRTLRFGSPPLRFGSSNFHLKFGTFREKIKISDILTENHEEAHLKGVLPKWGGSTSELGLLGSEPEACS